jgi:hypothetical protein
MSSPTLLIPTFSPAGPEPPLTEDSDSDDNCSNHNNGNNDEFKRSNSCICKGKLHYHVRNLSVMAVVVNIK